MELSEAIVARIKLLMKKRKLKIYDLSILSGIPRCTLSIFLNRKTKTMRLENLLFICEAFNMSLKEFFDDRIFENVEAKHWSNHNHQ